MENKDTKQIVGAIVLAGAMIAGAILLRGGGGSQDLSKASPKFNQCLDSRKYAQAVSDATTAGSKVNISGTPKGFILYDGNLVATIDGAEKIETVKPKIEAALSGNAPTIKNVQFDRSLDKEVTLTNPDPVSETDFVLGNPQAKVTIILYEDFQCPFCGMFFKQTEKELRDMYVKEGQVRLVYRDYAFLGPESARSAEAASCANEQGKFWEYHDYLYSHQMGENQGAFSDPNLKSFAGQLKLK